MNVIIIGNRALGTGTLTQRSCIKSGPRNFLGRGLTKYSRYWLIVVLIAHKLYYIIQGVPKKVVRFAAKTTYFNTVSLIALQTAQVFLGHSV